MFLLRALLTLTLALVVALSSNNVVCQPEEMDPIRNAPKKIYTYNSGDNTNKNNNQGDYDTVEESALANYYLESSLIGRERCINFDAKVMHILDDEAISLVLPPSIVSHGHGFKPGSQTVLMLSKFSVELLWFSFQSVPTEIASISNAYRAYNCKKNTEHCRGFNLRPIQVKNSSGYTIYIDVKIIVNSNVHEREFKVAEYKVESQTGTLSISFTECIKNHILSSCGADSLGQIVAYYKTHIYNVPTTIIESGEKRLAYTTLKVAEKNNSFFVTEIDLNTCEVKEASTPKVLLYTSVLDSTVYYSEKETGLLLMQCVPQRPDSVRLFYESSYATESEYTFTISSVQISLKR